MCLRLPYFQAFNGSKIQSPSRFLHPDIEFPNIDRLAKHAEDHPDVEFSFVISPHPLPLYAGASTKELAQYIGMRRYAVEKFSVLPNAHVYAFDDVDEIAFAEDIRLHLGIPATNLVPKMNAGFQ